jgi:hypothetical protein
MTSPTSPARFDVVEIMSGIREENRLKRERGIFTEEELDDLARARLRDFAQTAHIDPRLLDRFLDPGHDWNIATDYIIRTHRRGPAARLSLIGKRLVRPLVRLYTDHLLNRQTQINQYFCEVLHHSVREAVRLEAQVAALKKRCEELESRR